MFSLRLLGKWPNSYAFSKAMAEEAARRYSTGIPICVVRPSIVVSTWKEPIAGWTNNLYGATGVVVGSGIGLLRTLHCVPNNVAEIIPADIVINNIVVAAWDIAQQWYKNIQNLYTYIYFIQLILFYLLIYLTLNFNSTLIMK